MSCSDHEDLTPKAGMDGGRKGWLYQVHVAEGGCCSLQCMVILVTTLTADVTGCIELCLQVVCYETTCGDFYIDIS